MNMVTFYPSTYYEERMVVHTYRIALEYIMHRRNICTTQMCLLNKVKEYDVIRIVDGPDDVVTITNNHDGTYECDRTSRTLRRINSFFHLWENGEFDKGEHDEI